MDQAELRKSVNEEIEEFNRERARIRELIGRIGGVRYSHIDTLVNIAFITLVVGLFIVELTLHPFPTTVSIEIGVFLVSMKIVWMIHANQKFNHFVFWVLNSLEFRINANTNSLEEISKALKVIRRDRADRSVIDAP
ncbi:MAG: hypothetical protein CVV47_14890 [Spirochaetae bacterium HGW-Spirochaetae-3]|jgi:hypothetical protein|nr:MAG: hypothetical protein CVV47_14890 [Spirochaetae bacterium HGW-Spirochaetae-3]